MKLSPSGAQLCGPMDGSPPGHVPGIFRAEYWSGAPFAFSEAANSQKVGGDDCPQTLGAKLGASPLLSPSPRAAPLPSRLSRPRTAEPPLPREEAGARGPSGTKEGGRVGQGTHPSRKHWRRCHLDHARFPSCLSLNPCRQRDTRSPFGAAGLAGVQLSSLSPGF